MTDAGLAEVPNPSALFLAGRDHQAAGTAVFAGMEGTRPLLVEIQALVAPSALGMPRRAVVGWDPNRLSMVLAVLEAHGGIRLGDAQAGARLKEAQKLGFAKALIPQGRGEGDKALSVETLRHIADLVAGISAGAPRKGSGQRGRAASRYADEEV